MPRGLSMRLSSLFLLLSTPTLAAPLIGQEWTGRARVDGTVTDGGGAPLAGATITARHLAQNGGPQIRSDAEGRFVMDGLAPGSWMVEIAAPGHATRRIGVHLPSESSWLDLFEVRLERARPAAPPPARGSDGAPASGRDGPVSYEDVRAALAEGRFDRALGLLPFVEAEAPGEAHVLFEIGQGLLTAGATEEAVTFFGRALDRAPDHVDARYGRALALLALGRREAARRDFEAVVVLGPDSEVAEKAARALEQLAPGHASSTSPASPTRLAPAATE